MQTTIAEAAVVDCNAVETIGKILCTMRVSPWYSVYNAENHHSLLEDPFSLQQLLGFLVGLLGVG
jgi:hypothetical protein